MTGDGEWQAWQIDGRAGAKLCIGPVFLGEIAFPHDLGCGPRWKAWLNHEHLGYFRTETEARAKVEREIVKRVRFAWPAWTRFQRGRGDPPFVRGSATAAMALLAPAMKAVI